MKSVVTQGAPTKRTEPDTEQKLARPHITVRKLGKNFGGQPLYRDFDLDFPRGKIKSIFGPNGRSKSLVDAYAPLVADTKGAWKPNYIPTSKGIYL